MSKKARPSQEQIEEAYRILVSTYHAMGKKPVVVPKPLYELLLMSERVRGPLPAYWLKLLPTSSNVWG